MLCPDCRYQRETTKYEKKIFKKFMNMDVQKVWDANPKGCDNCRNGYKGRIALHEVLEIDEEIRIALSNENLDKKDLAKMVYSGNTISMLQDALIKCLEGKTSFEEVYRNIEIENEDGDNYESEMANEIKASVPVETHAEVSNDLLETPVSKQVSNVYTPQTFSAADFNPQAQQNQVQQQVRPQTQQQTQQQAQVQAQQTQAQAQIQLQTQQVQQVASVAPTPSVYPVNYQQAQVPNTQAQQQNYYYQMKLPTKHDDSKQIQAVIPELNTPQTQVQQINSNPYNGINQQQILDNSIPKLEQKI